MALRDRPPRPLTPVRPSPASTRHGPSWVDERASERGDQRVLQGFSALRAERVYGESDTCPGCAQARVDQDRADALCEGHLGEAMGMNATWDVPRGRG